MTSPNELSRPTRASGPDELRERLIAVGLADKADALVRLGRIGVDLLPLESSDAESALTRLGGRPLLPEATPWPAIEDDWPLSFIAQLNLAELAPLLPDEPLPSEGLLSFFYEAVDQDAWGGLPDEADHWAVVFTPSLDDCVLREFPDDLDDDGRFKPLALTPQANWMPSAPESFEVDATGIGDSWSTYGDALGEYTDPRLAGHRLLGHPQIAQSDMQKQCQLVSHGFASGDRDARSDPRRAELVPGSSDWRLLLQIDSENAAGMQWGDSGRIYWWIRDQDLRAGAWDKAWFVLQCS